MWIMPYFDARSGTISRLTNYNVIGLLRPFKRPNALCIAACTYDLFLHSTVIQSVWSTDRSLCRFNCDIMCYIF